MVNLDNFITPFRYEERKAVVLENNEEVLRVKSKSDGPFFVSKLAILPKLKSTDIYTDSLSGAKGILRFSPIGYLPINVSRQLPLTSYIPYYAMTGDIPPQIDTPFRSRAGTIPTINFTEIERVIEYLLGMQRPDFAFNLAWVYLFGFKNKIKWRRTLKRMTRIIWSGVPHVSDLYFVDRHRQTLLIPKHTFLYKALSGWWAISGGYHNKERTFLPCNTRQLIRLLNSIHSPFLQCKTKITIDDLFNSTINTALLPAPVNVKIVIPKGSIIYKNAIYLNDIPFYYTKREDTGKPSKAWWDDDWYETVEPYMDLSLFRHIRNLRQKKLSF